MATFSYSFLTLLYNAEMSPSKITPPPLLYIYSLPFLPILFPYIFLTLLYPSACYCCSWVMSIIVVQITRRNTYTVQRRYEREREREREDKQKRRRAVVVFFNIVRCTYTRRSRVMHVHLTLFVFFFFLLFSSSAVIYALSLRLVVAGIHRQGVMTRKERGEDVYGYMFGQTLNDERSQKSNPINCTKWKKRRKRRRLQKWMG